jgi:hypothetical protein
MLLSTIVAAAIVMMRGLAVMMSSRLMMGCSAMMVFARSMLFLGVVHFFPPEAPAHKILGQVFVPQPGAERIRVPPEEASGFPLMPSRRTARPKLRGYVEWA